MLYVSGPSPARATKRRQESFVGDLRAHWSLVSQEINCREPSCKSLRGSRGLPLVKSILSLHLLIQEPIPVIPPLRSLEGGWEKNNAGASFTAGGTFCRRVF